MAECVAARQTQDVAQLFKMVSIVSEQKDQPPLNGVLRKKHVVRFIRR